MNRYKASYSGCEEVPDADETSLSVSSVVTISASVELAGHHQPTVTQHIAQFIAAIRGEVMEIM